jgi:hypothetical protein
MMFSAIFSAQFSPTRRPAVTLPSFNSIPALLASSIPFFHKLLLRSPARPFPGFISSRAIGPIVSHSSIILSFLAIIHHRSPPLLLFLDGAHFPNFKSKKSKQFSSRIPASRDKLMNEAQSHRPNLMAVLMTDD